MNLMTNDFVWNDHIHQMKFTLHLVFPHCGADARKEGHVVPVVTFDAFRLHACREGGELEDQVIEFAWDTISTFEIDEESMTFIFQYR